MATRNYDEIQADYIREFGEKDGLLVQRLTNSVSQLTLQWRMFLFFYCGPRERVEVLNEASGLTAKTIQNLVWDNSILTVRRLTDRETTSGDTNVSLAHLPRIAQEKGCDGFEAYYEDVLSACKTTRKYATKYIAHSDYNHAVGKKEALTNRGETTNAIREIMKFVELFHEEVRGVQYRLVPMTTVRDEQQFLQRLFLGNIRSADAKAERIKRARSGDWAALKETDFPDWLSDYEFRDNPF